MLPEVAGAGQAVFRTPLRPNGAISIPPMVAASFSVPRFRTGRPVNRALSGRPTRK